MRPTQVMGVWMNPLSFVHLTDLHITDPNQPDEHLWGDTAANLELAKSLISRLEPQPEFIVVSGDLTNHGSAESFQALKAQLAGFSMPVLLALGNHDKRGPFYEVMLDRHEDTDAPYFYSRTFGDLHVIVLDSSTPGKVDGSIEPEQFAWLEAELNAQPEQPKLIVIHHPPCPIKLSIFDHITFQAEDAAALGRLLEGRNIVGVLSGHVHFDRYTTWHGVPCIIGAGLHNITDVLESDGIRALRGAAFNLCRFEDGALTVTHVPLPTDRSELHRVTLEQLQKYMKNLEAEQQSSGGPDDLKRIEGIGPKISEALQAAGITRFAQLAQASEDDLRTVLEKAELPFAPGLSTWAEQAGLLARGDEEGFKALTDRLVAGRAPENEPVGSA